MAKRGLYSNIHAKRERIKKQKAAGKKPERMRKKGAKGAPTDKAFKHAAKTAKKPTRKKSKKEWLKVLHITLEMAKSIQAVCTKCLMVKFIAEKRMAKIAKGCIILVN